MIHHNGDRHPRARARPWLTVSIVAIALGLAGVTHAQVPANPEPAPAPLAPPAMQPPPAPPPAPAPVVLAASAVPDARSPGTALSLSVLGTAAGFGMMVIGDNANNGSLSLAGLVTTVVGPSLGHFYAGDSGRGLTQSAIRAGSVGVLFAGALWLASECGFFFVSECEPGPGPGIMLATGLVVGASSALYSIYDAPRAARRHNARARRLVITPAPLAGPDHSSGFGLHLGGQF